MNIGIIGCGNISSAYLKCGRTFDILNYLSVADLNIDRAKAKAEDFGVPKACSPEQLLADPDVELVINLTVPNAHYQVCMAAVMAGKHVYVEKPLCLTREEGKQLLDLAAEKGLRVGAAPDTFLGQGLQTCRKLVDSGAIGEPIGAAAVMLSHGPEDWHPDPEFFYKIGGGPMFDMGPYYLTALISLLGPIRRLTGSARITFPERTIGSEARRGTKVVVEVPTHIAGVIDFANGAIASITTSFDVWKGTAPPIEFYGSESTLLLPDPNHFGGQVKLWSRSKNEWEEVEQLGGYAENSRSIGVADMAYAIGSGRPHRASGAQGYHVLEAMHGFHDATITNAHYVMQSTCVRPEALPDHWPSAEA
jgi:predicted dehydrogenase